jgi:PAS domain S-box-containing protein
MLPREVRDRVDAVSAMSWISTEDPASTYFNLAWRRFAGWAVEGEVWRQGVHPADRDRVVAAYRASFERRTPHAIELRLQTPEGSYAWFRDQASPWYHADGSFGGFSGIVTAVGEQARALAA